jgi:hypothetical protein
MNTEDKYRIVRGQVFCDGRWLPIENKLSLEQQRQKKIEAGYVFFQGEWISIDEKLARTVPSKYPEERMSPSIILNVNDNRTTYTIDNRTIHEHEHRHVHLDSGSLRGYLHQTLPPEETGARVVDESGKNVRRLSGGKKSAALDDGRKVRGLLKPPDD